MGLFIGDTGWVQLARGLNDSLDAELPLAELSAARLDGDVVRFGPSYFPIDVPPSVSARARSLAPVLPPRFIADRRTAAWVFGALPALPARLDACVRTESRPSALCHFDGSVREVVIDDSEILDVDGVLVTTPLRTMFDLLREPRFDSANSRLVAAIGGVTGVTRERCESYISGRSHLPRKSQTLARLARVFAGERNAA